MPCPLMIDEEATPVYDVRVGPVAIKEVPINLEPSILQVATRPQRLKPCPARSEQSIQRDSMLLGPVKDLCLKGKPLHPLSRAGAQP